MTLENDRGFAGLWFFLILTILVIIDPSDEIKIHRFSFTKHVNGLASYVIGLGMGMQLYIEICCPIPFYIFFYHESAILCFQLVRC